MVCCPTDVVSGQQLSLAPQAETRAAQVCWELKHGTSIRMWTKRRRRLTG
jgi:hypothetical protein